MVSELPESAAHVATDPNRVYYVGAGYNPCLLPGLLFFLTRPCRRPSPVSGQAHDMLDGLRQGLVSNESRHVGASVKTAERSELQNLLKYCRTHKEPFARSPIMVGRFVKRE